MSPSYNRQMLPGRSANPLETSIECPVRKTAGDAWARTAKGSGRLVCGFRFMAGHPPRQEQRSPEKPFPGEEGILVHMALPSPA